MGLLITCTGGYGMLITPITCGYCPPICCIIEGFFFCGVCGGCIFPLAPPCVGVGAFCLAVMTGTRLENLCEPTTLPEMLAPFFAKVCYFT